MELTGRRGMRRPGALPERNLDLAAPSVDLTFSLVLGKAVALLNQANNLISPSLGPVEFIVCQIPHFTFIFPLICFQLPSI